MSDSTLFLLECNNYLYGRKTPSYEANSCSGSQEISHNEQKLKVLSYSHQLPSHWSLSWARRFYLHESSNQRRFCLDWLTREDGTDRQYRNVGNHQPTNISEEPRPQTRHGESLKCHRLQFPTSQPITSRPILILSFHPRLVFSLSQIFLPAFWTHA
jgi:hypothetical protein